MVTEAEVDGVLGEEEEPVVEPEPKEDEGVKPDDSAPPAEEDTKDADRISELEKMNNGLLQAKTAAMAKVDKSGESLTAANDRIRALEEQIKIQAAIPAAAPVENKPVENVSVEYDDEGNAFIPAKNLPVDTSQADKIAALEAKLAKTANALESSNQNRLQEEYTKSFLGEKEGYKEAYTEVMEQWTYLKTELFDQFVSSKGIAPPKTQAEALEIASNPEFQTAFKSKYPQGDVESVLQAGLYQNRYYEKKALDTVLAQRVPASTHAPIPTDKPLPLGTVPGSNQAIEENSLAEYSDMSMEDFLLMTPEKETRMNRLLQEKGI